MKTITRVMLAGSATALVAAMTAGLGAAGPETALVEAVKKADSTTVKTLIQRRVNVNAAEADGTTPLHWAAERDDLATVQLLLKAGANAKATNRYGVSPLMAACINGNAAIVEALLKAGADPNATTPEGETALMTAARTGKSDALKVLLANGAKVNEAEGWRSQTALMWAASENNGEAVKVLAEVGADIKARSSGGYTALLFAARSGSTDAVRALLAAGANLNDYVVTTKAKTVASNNDPFANATRTAAGGLLSAEGTAERPTGPILGPSALDLVALNAHWELGVELLAKGADPNYDGNGYTALTQVALTRRIPPVKGVPAPVPTGKLDSIAFAKALVAHGANLNARLKKEPKDGVRNNLNRVGSTAYLMAAKLADAELMRFLAESGADTQMPTEGGTTPLMVASGVGIFQLGESVGTNEEAFESVKVAWEFGSRDVNHQDDRGETALHGTAHRGAVAVTQFLVDHGANTEIRDERKYTAWTVANGTRSGGSYARYPEVQMLLEKLGAKDHGEKRRSDFNPADLAASEGDEVAAAKVLLKQ